MPGGELYNENGLLRADLQTIEGAAEYLSRSKTSRKQHFDTTVTESARNIDESLLQLKQIHAFAEIPCGVRRWSRSIETLEANVPVEPAVVMYMPLADRTMRVGRIIADVAAEKVIHG